MNGLSKLVTTGLAAGALLVQVPNMETAKNNTREHYKEVLNIGDSKEQLEKERKQMIINLMVADLKNGEMYDEIKGDLKYDVVGNIGVVIYKGSYTFYRYSKDNGIEYFTNVPDLMDDSSKEDKEDLEFAFNKAGIVIKGQQIFNKNGKKIVPFLDNGNINPDFVKMVYDISFYKNTRIIFGAMKSIMEGEKIKSSVNSFHHSIVKGVLRIKDVMYFRSKGYIPDDNFRKLLERAKQELLNQCGDPRFDNLVIGEKGGEEVTAKVTKNELDEYLRLSLITEKMYYDCLEIIERREQQKKAMAERNKIGEYVRGEIKKIIPKK